MGLLFVLFVATASLAQTPLQEKIRAIAAEAKGQVSVACSLPGARLNCDLNPHTHPPMQSVFKLPLVITMMHRIEQGEFTLDQAVRFLPEDRFIPHEYSPLQDKYPEANVDVPMRELLRLAVSESDNAAADILLRIGDGPQKVDSYIASLGIQGFHLEDSEHSMQREFAAQYRDWFEPAGAVELLRLLNDRSPLSPEHTRLLFDWMEATSLTSRLKGDLPESVLVFHKTGSSGVHNGIAPATNDIGLIDLPDGKRLAIAVFVTDSKANEATRERVIAKIGRAAYDAARSGGN
jgi:beta-lactamase class A